MLSACHANCLQHFNVPTNQISWIGDTVIIYPMIVVAIFVVIQQINGFVTTPRIIGNSLWLHPMIVIFSLFFWSILIGGFLGTLLSIPLTASIKVLFKRYIWQRKIIVFDNDNNKDATTATSEG